MFTTPKKLLAGGFALAMLATACGDDLPANTSNASGSGTQSVTIDGKEIELTSGLAAFDSCDALLTHLRTEGAERAGAWGFNDGNYWGGIDIAVEMADTMAVGVMEEDGMEESSAAFDTADSGGDASTSATAPESAANRVESDGAALKEGEDFSGTNNQEVGVDEPDYVKTDGRRILTMTNGRFTYVDAGDGNPVKRGSIMVGHETSDMLVVGDTVYLFGTSWGNEFYPEPFAVDAEAVDSDGDAEADFAEDEALRIVGPSTFQGPQVRITEIDISNADSPTVMGQLDIEGHYLSSRLVDGTITVALQSDQHDLGFVFPQGEKGEEQAEKFNKEIVMETEINEWLPSYSLDANGTTSSGQLSDCNNVHAPADFAGFGSLSVISIDGANGLSDPGASSVLASGQNVYASTESMWISTNQWFDWSTFDDSERRDAEQSYTTQIHGFSISGATPEYQASGSVRGHLLNQFALSEFDGVLRVASTDGTIWGNDQESESFVTTFAVNENELTQLGQVGEMGKGEQIFSVRFVGTTAYVVTFRQTDPFYTVDLSDPANPEVLGELKITGFSGQLHPLGPDHILGIGQEATDEGRTTGAKVTLFDVGDLANPIDVATWTVDNSWSDAQWDHKAFLWWPQENLAVLPVQNWQEQFFGAVAFRIDLGAGTIEEAGRISHDPKGADTVGTTDCTVIEPDELEQYRDGGDELSELANMSWEIDASGGQLQVCDPGEGGATGLYCEKADWLDASEIGIEGGLEICWPDGPGQDPVIRTLVIDDTLWSLSWSRLQANDLATFNAGEFVEIGR
ncbi:MAG: putative secreted protein with C-terminal beta-propeller domain [Candidatus Poriferisodalaceae bacterium]|jgi:uncharacterized secreted protein with C-terminal beta-propeller domain